MVTASGYDPELMESKSIVLPVTLHGIGGREGIRTPESFTGSLISNQLHYHFATLPNNNQNSRSRIDDFLTSIMVQMASFDLATSALIGRCFQLKLHLLGWGIRN